MSDRPLSNPSGYVEEHREDLMVLLRSGEPYVRGLALYVLIAGGSTADWELVEHEVQLAQEVDDDLLQEVIG